MPKALTVQELKVRLRDAKSDRTAAKKVKSDAEKVYVADPSKPTSKQYKDAIRGWMNTVNVVALLEDKLITATDIKLAA